MNADQCVNCTKEKPCECSKENYVTTSQLESEDIEDQMEQNILPNTMQIQDLPVEIRVRIFKHLDYRERIRLESVCHTWRTMVWATWKEQRILRFGREMLQNSQQNELAPLESIVRRCAPFLDELHLLGDFDIQMRFGRIFSQLAPFGRLAHLHIKPIRALEHTEHQNEKGEAILLQRTLMSHWILGICKKFSAIWPPQLLSLAVIPIDKAMVALRELLANCNKLEKLQIVDIYFSRFFAGHSENNSGISQPSVAKIEYKCSFMPSTLKFLHILDNFDDEDYEDPDDLVNILLSLLANCPQLRFMHIFINTEFDLFKLIEKKNPRELDKIIRLQFPYFIVHFDYLFQYIQRSEFRNLRALKMVETVEAADILQVAKCCSNLEHLGIHLFYDPEWDMHMQNYVVDTPDLLAIHQFQRLSSMEIKMGFMHLYDFHEWRCPGGERADITFLNILTKLDQIHPLRSLDLKEGDGSLITPGLSQNYLLQMLTQLKHLETFSCEFYLLNVDIDDMTGIGHFCAQLEEIFNSQEGATKKSFKFALLANPDQGRRHLWGRGREAAKNLLVEWQKGSGKKKSTMNWHCTPWHVYFEPERSIVLHELFTSQFGQRTSSMLFDSFDTMEGNSQWC